VCAARARGGADSCRSRSSRRRHLLSRTVVLVTFFSPADSDRSLSHDPAQILVVEFRSDPHTARVRSVSESTGACSRACSGQSTVIAWRVLAPGGPAVGQDAIPGGQAGAIKGKARAGGGRHACPRRGRCACRVGRSCRIEGQVGRRVLVLQTGWPQSCRNCWCHQVLVHAP
jgi:hypothetical protein